MITLRQVFAVLFLILFIQASPPVTIGGNAAKGIKGNNGHGTSANGGKTFNLITDFGAACAGNSAVDDRPAMSAAGVAMRAFQAANPHAPVTLVIPPGSNCTILTCPVSPFGGVENFTWVVTNATITGGCGKWGTGDFQGAGGDGTARSNNFNTNNIGDTCVTMTTPGTEVNYPVGNWVVVAGQGIQVESFPPNYVNWEFAQVASRPTNQLCFKAPLQHVYPGIASPSAPLDLSLANCSNIYCGGPGRVVLLGASWGGYWHIVGGTWFFNNPTTWTSRTLIMDNVTFIGSDGSQNCHFPSVVQTITYNNVNFNCISIEVDKEIDAMIVNGGVIRGFVFQSPSVNSLTITGTAALSQTQGAPRSTICNNSTLGGFSMGNSLGTMPQSFSGTNCSFSSVGNSGFFNGLTPAANQGSAAPHQPYYNGDGTFHEDHADIYGGLAQWASTGGKMNMIFSGAINADNEITIGTSNIPGFVPGSTDQTIIYPVTPNFGATLPPSAIAPAWFTDQARDISCSGCLGSRIAFDLNFSAAQHQPLNTYVNRTYTCSNNIVNVPGSYDINAGDGAGNGLAMSGQWVSLIINVSVADTNPSDAGGALLPVRPGNVFNTATGVMTFSPGGDDSINLIHAGMRTILTTSTSGALAGDTLNAPGANSWMAGSGNQLQNPGVTNGPAAQCPVVNVAWQTTR